MSYKKRNTIWAWVGVWLAVILAVILGISRLSVQHTGQSVAQFNKMTPWLIARAGGVTALILLTVLVCFGMILSSAPNKQSWRLTRYLLPWHRYLALFMLFFLGLHIITIAIDPFAKVGVLGALIPGLSAYRTVPVAIGTISFFALLLVAVTARFPRILPNNRWLTVHRISLYTFAAAWSHGALTGADTPSIRWLYAVTGLCVVAFIFIRYWIVHQRGRGRTDVQRRVEQPLQQTPSKSQSHAHAAAARTNVAE